MSEMKLSSRPVWLVGFRPFFALACLSGLALPMLWALIFAGALPAPPSAFAAVQWHAHEMFFGFGLAVLGGFLLTSTKNWVEVRGYHGRPLLFLALAWLLERAGMWFGGQWHPLLFLVANNLFLVSLVAMILWTLIRNRERDTYRDNLFFILILPLFIVSKQLMLSADYFQAGWSMALGIFRMAFLVMLERTLTQFMKGVFQASILRHVALDMAIKGLGLVLIFESQLPAQAAGWIALALALLLAFRFAFWKPQLAMRRLDIGIMYLGYIALAFQLLVEFIDRMAHPAWAGAFSVHLFSFGVMGLIIPAMLIRISKGHTGRKVAFDNGDKLVLWIMILAFVLRVVAPQAYPAGYMYWIAGAAACWCAAFATLAWRYIPFLMQPRVDGKEH
jgi:uncharacterized protein involved in response to NO